LAQKRRSGKEVGVEEVQRSFSLFYDADRSVKFVSEFEKKFIGEEGAVSLSNTNGADAMELS